MGKLQLSITVNLLDDLVTICDNKSDMLQVESDESINDWMTERNCSVGDNEQFFPDEKGNYTEAQLKITKIICSECVVKEECLDTAYLNNINYGIYGGLTENQRRSRSRHWLAERKRRFL